MQICLFLENMFFKKKAAKQVYHGDDIFLFNLEANDIKKKKR